MFPNVSQTLIAELMLTLDVLRFQVNVIVPGLTPKLSAGETSVGAGARFCQPICDLVGLHIYHCRVLPVPKYTLSIITHCCVP